MRPSYREIVAHFRRSRGERRQAERAYDLAPKSLRAAVSQAALSIDFEQKRHSHQRRIPGRVLIEVQQDLLAVLPRIRACRTFEKLHSLIAERVLPFRGAGELLVYDVAQRIGVFQGIEPDVVYLHAGTRKGARALGLGGKTVARSDLPMEFRHLSAAELEDFFCNYAYALNGEPLRNRRNCTGKPRGRGWKPC